MQRLLCQSILLNPIENNEAGGDNTCLGYPCSANIAPGGTSYGWLTIGENQRALEIIWEEPVVIFPDDLSYLELPEGSDPDMLLFYEPEANTVYSVGANFAGRSLGGKAVEWMIYVASFDEGATDTDILAYFQPIFDTMCIKQHPSDLNPNARDTSGKYYWYNTACTCSEAEIEDQVLYTIPRYPIMWISNNVTSTSSITSSTNLTVNSWQQGSMSSTGWTVKEGVYNGRKTWELRSSGATYWRFQPQQVHSGGVN